MCISQYKDFFENDLMAKNMNFKKYLVELPVLSIQEKNRIIELHNSASDDEVYGQNLYKYLQQLILDQKLPKGSEDKLYVLSVDWPESIFIENIVL